MTKPMIVVNPRPNEQMFISARFDSRCDNLDCRGLITKDDLIARTNHGDYICKKCATS